jgi:hypothetical protein
LLSDEQGEGGAKMIDQLIIGDKASFDDFGASVAKSAKTPPKKKSIKETVPFSNVTYDFSAIDGEIYWEEQALEYELEMFAPTPERLETMKTALKSWLMNVINQDLHDPFIPDYHFVATFDDMSFEDDAGMDKTTAKVKFTAYPYQIANHAMRYEYTIAARGSITAKIVNNSSHKIAPTITTDKGLQIKLNSENASYNVVVGTTKDSIFKLAAGVNTLIITNITSQECNMSIAFNEEVF